MTAAHQLADPEKRARAGLDCCASAQWQAKSGVSRKDPTARGGTGPPTMAITRPGGRASPAAGQLRAAGAAAHPDLYVADQMVSRELGQVFRD